MAVMSFAAPVGVIELNEEPRQGSVLVTVLHSLLEFVLHAQGSIGGDTKVPGKAEGGDAVLGLSDQINGQEPDGQRQISVPFGDG